MLRVLRRIENSMNDDRVIESHAENKYHIDLELAKLGYRFPNTTPRTIDDIAKKNRGFLEAQKQIKFMRRLERDISGVVLYSKPFPNFFIDGGDKTFVENMTINGIVLSALRSIGTICDCLNTGHFSDAHVLLRRLRDDLFFYIYLLVGNKCDPLHKSSLWIGAARKWFSNKRDEFEPYKRIQSMLSATVFSEKNSKAMTSEYDSENELDSLFIQGEKELKATIQEFAKHYQLAEKNMKYNKILNNSVHGNGSALQNVNLQLLDYMRCDGVFPAQINDVYEMTVFFVLLFLSLLALIHPGALTSNDYVNAYDNGDVPEEGTQYYLCPALLPYLRRGDEVIGDGFYSALMDISQMKEMSNPIGAYEVKVPDKIKSKLIGKNLYITLADGENVAFELNGNR